MPLPEDLTPVSRRRVLLIEGEKREWWVYESENQPGHRDNHGVKYDGITYTIRLPMADDDHVLTLLATEVEGFVLATAYQYGEEAVTAIAYRDGLSPEMPPTTT